MKILLILFLTIQLFTEICFGIDKNENKMPSDTTSSEGMISLKLGYFPFHSKMKSAGIFASISNNGDSQSFFDIGCYFSIYVGKQNLGSQSVLIFGGFNFGHKFDFYDRYIITKVATGLVFSSTYPSFANVIEIDIPLLLFKSSSIDFSISCGLIRFSTVLPVTFSLGYSF